MCTLFKSNFKFYDIIRVRCIMTTLHSTHARQHNRKTISKKFKSLSNLEFTINYYFTTTKIRK